MVVYPQTTSSDLSPFNPEGCWDWSALLLGIILSHNDGTMTLPSRWGYVDENYAVQSGTQIKFVNSIINYFLQL